MTSEKLSSEANPLESVVSEEEKCLGRIINHAEERKKQTTERRRVDYDTQLLELRDEIAAARTEDVPPLLEQMERLQGIAHRQRLLTQGFIDPRSPYFGRMVLEENERAREVLIGRSTYLDSKAGIRIVDWRDAPVSRLFYRYNEGDDYDEVFGDREIEGSVKTRRSLTIVEGRLRRIVTPQGTFLRPENGDWRLGGKNVRLAGGEGTATRAEHQQAPTKLGIGVEADIGGEDKHLREVTALIDPRQFDLITKPDSGLVVIQGGAGSGKTTIGLHRLAYLAFQDRRRFRPDKMLIVVFNDALARYISQVLPALDVNGVAVRTYEGWANKLRLQLVPQLTRRYSQDTPAVVTRLKKHPAMLGVIRAYQQEVAANFQQRFTAIFTKENLRERAERNWNGSRGKALTHRLHALKSWLSREGSGVATSHALEREIERCLRQTADLVTAWSDILTDEKRIHTALNDFYKREGLNAESSDRRYLNPRELARALEWCEQRVSLVAQAQDLKEEKREEKRDGQQSRDEDYGAVDGGSLEDAPQLDVEDDALLLALWQSLRGPIRRPGSRDALVYEHILIDEAQDLSPVELSVVLGCTSRAQSVTLAGDTAQRLHMDNGFGGWAATLNELGLSHVEVEPLKLSYRSTAEIVEFSREVLGDLADQNAPVATRHGAPVELFRFADLGDAVGFLSDALRDLIDSEPRSSIAVITRHPEQADLVYQGLFRAELPRCRRVAQQDFLFKPGVDVTDIRQVKGLEFDYVILVEVSEASFPRDSESRHLLHIAATRAAHQLWLLTSGKPSPLLPQELRERSF